MLTIICWVESGSSQGEYSVRRHLSSPAPSRRTDALRRREKNSAHLHVPCMTLWYWGSQEEMRVSWEQELRIFFTFEVSTPWHPKYPSTEGHPWLQRALLSARNSLWHVSEARPLSPSWMLDQVGGHVTEFDSAMCHWYVTFLGACLICHSRGPKDQGQTKLLSLHRMETDGWKRGPLGGKQLINDPQRTLVVMTMWKPNGRHWGCARPGKIGNMAGRGIWLISRMMKNMDWWGWGFIPRSIRNLGYRHEWEVHLEIRHLFWKGMQKERYTRWRLFCCMVSESLSCLQMPALPFTSGVVSDHLHTLWVLP